MLILAARLFDGVHDEHLEDPVLEIEGGRIRAVRRRTESAAALADAEVLDLGGVTLMPGLVDAHQHLAFDASEDPVATLVGADDTELLDLMRGSARRALVAGITTVRDLGDRGYLSLTLRDRFREGAEVGPRLVCSGPPLTVAGGHCWFLGGEADGEDGLRRAVDEHAKRGVDLVKVMATGGHLTSGSSPSVAQYTAAELRAVVETAHAHGLPVAAHAHGPEGIERALDAGVDTLEHCTFVTEDGVDASPEVLERIARSGIGVSATAATLPVPGGVHPAMAARLPAIAATFTTLHRLGARLVCSSDAGIGTSKPHDVLPYGVIGMLPRIGMGPAEALRAVTSRAAEVCGVGEVTGTLEPGKDADVLAVVGDPVADLSALLDVAAVLVRGHPVDLPR